MFVQGRQGIPGVSPFWNIPNPFSTSGAPVNLKGAGPPLLFVNALAFYPNGPQEQ
uniref:Uncharacterized protein n=1 Tax=Anguilla anguilla TaxID=7936 RepID=A0A0E9T0M7_ANGAN